jgi:hypothetical protein
VKCGDEIPLNQRFLVVALSPPLYLCHLTLRWLITEVKVILGISRKKKSKISFVLLLLVFAFIGIGALIPTPSQAATFTLTGTVTPSTGSTAGGTAIVIGVSGVNGGTTTVTIGGNACTSIQVYSTQINCTTPAGTVGQKNIVVTQSSGSVTLTNGFTYATPPTVSSVSPNSGNGAGGTSITITGSDFVSGATVTIGGSSCTSVVFISSTSLTCTTPARSVGAANIVVTNPNSISGTLSGGFSFTHAVSSVSPTSGTTAGGTLLTISGTGFTASYTVTIGGNDCTSPSRPSSSQIRCTTPSGTAGAKDVVVTKDGVSTTLSSAFTYAVPPTLVSVSPAFGNTTGGTTITLTGTDFVLGATVTIGGATCTSVAFNSSTSITCTTPARSAGASNIVLTNPSALTSTLSGGYTYISVPTGVSNSTSCSGSNATVSFSASNGGGAITSWEYSYDGINFAVIPGASGNSGSYSVTSWFSSTFAPYTRAINSSGASSAARNSSCGSISATRSKAPTVSTFSAPSGSLIIGSSLTSQVTFAAHPVAVTLTYSWQRCTSASSPYNCTTISGATNSNYVLSGDDSGLYIRSVVVGSGTVDGDTQSTTGTSDLTTAIAATPDTTAPTITSFSSTTSDGSYKAGSAINITATLSEIVTAAAQVTVTLDTGETVVLTHASSGTTLTGSYIIGAGKASTDLTVSSYVLTSAPTDTAGNLMTSTTLPTGSNNIAGAKAIVVDTTAPTITAISSSSSDGTFGLGSDIVITATTSEAVISGSSFTVILETGSVDRTITLTASANGTTLTGTYTVQSGDTTLDLTANGLSTGTITDVAGNALTSTSLPSGANIADLKAIVLDTVVPTVTATTGNVVFGGNAVVQSSESGTVYLVNTSVTVTNLASITSAADASWNSASITSASTNTNLAVTGLSAGTYKAYAVDAAGNLSLVSTATVTVLPQTPGTPGTPIVVAGDERVTVTVVAPSDGGTPTSYTITASPGSATCTVTGALGSCVVTGLANGTAYTFTTTATNSGGTSFSSLVSDTSTPSLTPVAPSVANTNAPSGTLTNGNTLTSAVTFTGTPTPDLTYTWQRCTSVSDLSTCIAISGATSATYTLTDIDAAKFIRSVVTATNTTGSVVGTSVVTSAIAAMAPTAPTSLTATAGDASAVISFTAGGTGGAVISNYKYSIDGTNYTALSPVDVASPVTITGLTNGTAYTIYLKAVNEAGDSVASSAVSVTPVDNIFPTLSNAVLASNGTTLTLTFSEALSATTAPASTYAVTSNGAAVTVSSAVVSGSTVVLTLASAVDASKAVLVSYTDPSVDNDSTSVQDSAGNDAATFTAQTVTNNSTNITKPGTPGIPTAVAGNAEATVTVSAPTSGGTPTSYTVTASPGDAMCMFTGASGSCTLFGLTNGTAYTFTTTATNAGGTSDNASAASNSITPAAPAAAPVTPTPVYVEPVCNSACVAAEAAAAKAAADAAAKVIADAAAKVAAEKAAVEAKIVSDAAAKVAAEKVVVDKTAAEAAAKAAIESAAIAAQAKAAADAAAVAAAAQAKAAAEAQQAAV